MVTMIGPRTSACPVAVTVLGKPKLRKSPCARTDPDENNIKTETKTANRNFILPASYSTGVYSEPALSKNNTRQIVRNYAGRSRRHELLGHSRSSWRPR